ncbi:hypothetical protein SAMN05216267_10487 [Actinacidiphila rubida]|uniref:Secreted protein n=1 Tax=Actinacidiphila rubida TaxID=310780 RepID=A0A1H8T4K3_9ACTN|nr:hypothetical protein [Actinacidiphila rubida]SEO85887.1 hypothetical protein SAMN05216267_10487 [Actinacidiphila rubida]
MTVPARPPLLFLDVDGPLIPFGAAAGELPGGRYPTYESPAAPELEAVHPLLARIDPALGPRLLALPCELVWATTWEYDANLLITPLLGLPELPVVCWPDLSDEQIPLGLHWKTRTLLGWSAGRPFVWVDDEITATDRAWVAARHPARALLHRVDPRHGLTDRDFAVLEAWLRRGGTGYGTAGGRTGGGEFGDRSRCGGDAEGSTPGAVP